MINRLFQIICAVGLIFVTSLAFAEISPGKTSSILNHADDCSGKMILGSFYESESVRTLYSLIEKAEATADLIDIQAVQAAIQQPEIKASEAFLYRYLVARVHFAWGLFYQNKKEAASAEASFEKALDWTRESIALNESFSDAHRLVGDIYGVLIDVKGPVIGPMIYGPFYGPMANHFVKKAAALDSGNPEAHLGVGRGYLYTPFLFGGSKRKAIDSMKAAIQICPFYYQGHLWLGEVYRVKGDMKQAKQSFQEALSLKPESYWAKEVLHKVEK